MSIDIRRWIAPHLTRPLTAEQSSELVRIQVEVDALLASIQQGAVKTTAWTDEERADMAARREADNADAYERGLDGKPIKVRIVPPDAEHPMARVFRVEAETAMQRGKP